MGRHLHHPRRVARQHMTREAHAERKAARREAMTHDRTKEPK